MERATSGLGIVVKKQQVSELKVGANVTRCPKFKEVYNYLVYQIFLNMEFKKIDMILYNPFGCIWTDK